MNQSNGRFFPGINPHSQAIASDSPLLPQLRATVALAHAARFTGDETYTIRATQAVLVLLAQIRVPAESPQLRVPTITDPQCSSVLYAALLAQAIWALPDADTALQKDAEQLCVFVRQQQRADGSFAQSDEYGPALLTLALHVQKQPDAAADAAPSAALLRGIAAAIQQFQSTPQADYAAAILPALCISAIQTKKPEITKAALQLGDWLCSCQYTRGDAPQVGWAGSFRPQPGATSPGWEPRSDAALIAGGLAAATQLTRHVPDLTRHTRFRAAMVEALEFTRRLQYTPESTTRFEPAFAQRFLVGGMCHAPSDPVATPEATARLVESHVIFLTSGEAGLSR
ncbi:MAG: hypothetical protein LC104_09075 [Bacteroidales bacterium]|nr:hypothetical protein [Bacteroidales bacterium]